MPIYEYQCQSCGHSLEKLQRIKDEPLKHCPDCGEAKLNRLVSAAAFRLKGSGWYETDFKKGDKKNLHDSDAAKSTAATKSTPDSGNTTEPKKSESKPKATKSDAA